MKHYATLPPWLKPSARTDILHLDLKVRPAIRTELAIPVSRDVVRIWMRRLGWYTAIDHDDFLVASRSSTLALMILAIDRDDSPHTFRLGRALGYPTCCCRAAASVGEQNLDSWALALSQRGFIGRFRLIDPTHYRDGNALICHIPCSTFCQASLQMAEATLAALRRAIPPLPVFSASTSRYFNFSGQIGSELPLPYARRRRR